MKAIRVRELNKYIKKYISMDYLLSDLYVEGEISNFKEHSNGNAYLSLKDENSKINAIIYYTDYEKIKFKPNDGDKVIARGAISFYEKDGIVTFFIREFEKVGTGDLYEKYLVLKELLLREGLFDSSHKKKIPYFPKKVGVITSQTGAAIRDIINVLRRRNSSIDIILYPALVQGDKAHLDLIKGLDYFSKNPVDTIIIGRGGGSFEELFAFNNEELARKIYNINIPIISAVGHEVDYVISDFVSDLRAPTPSAAAEIVSMSKEDLNNRNYLLINRIERIIDYRLKEEKDELLSYKKDLDNKFSKKRDKYIKELNYLRGIFISKAPKIKDKKKELFLSKRSLDKYLNYNISNKSRELKFLENRLYATSFKIKSKKDLIYSFYNSLKSKNPRIKLISEKKKVNELKFNLDRAFIEGFNRKKYKLLDLKLRLKSKTNGNIYLKDNNGKLILSAKDLKVKDIVDINFDDGVVSSTVNSIKKR